MKLGRKSDIQKYRDKIQSEYKKFYERGFKVAIKGASSEPLVEVPKQFRYAYEKGFKDGFNAYLKRMGLTRKGWGRFLISPNKVYQRTLFKD